MTTVYVRASRARVLEVIRSIPSAARQGGPADKILVNAGTAALKRVDKAFRVKSRGGTDEAGERWKPLSPYTVAKRLRREKPTGDQYRPSSNLSPNQREQWWNFYRSALARFHDKGVAARIAWSQLKRRGGVGHFDKYAAVLILRDTEALLRSLTPGAEHNVFRVQPGAVEVGTDRKAAAAHHSGAKNLPQRRLWPHPSKWTSVWWQDVLGGARDGVVQLLVEKLQ